MKKHVIESILPGSIAEECGFEKGDKLISINGNPIEDTFDYQYLISDEFLVLEAETKQGEVVEIEIEKDAGEDLGLIFENSFMDNYRSCKNKCIFCFIDQMPPGMRETLYFKDDDTRLSFLQGNYVTLTNLSDEDLERIIRYRMEPLNISFQTMNPDLRCKMLNNRFAGEALKKADRLFEAEITMNGQIVLCRGVNDGEELEFSLKKLYEYVPVLQSVSVVPVGLSKYREGLYPLKPFTKDDACSVIDCIEQWQKKAWEEKGTHFVHASDEWYFLAERPIPEEERYDGYLQLENGVGMVRSFREDFARSLKMLKKRKKDNNDRTLTDTDYIQDVDNDCESQTISCDCPKSHQVENPYGPSGNYLFNPDGKEESPKILSSGEERLEPAGADDTISGMDCKDEEQGVIKTESERRVKKITLATGRLFAPVLEKCVKELAEVFPDSDIRVFAVRNDFFGENITVAGLVTGTDLIAQLKDEEIGDVLVIPTTMLRFEEDVFLDDITVPELRDALHCRVDIVKSSGDYLVEYLERVL